MPPAVDWDSAAFDLDPVAEHTGPFVRREFLRTWWEHFGEGQEAYILEDDAGLVPLRWTTDTIAFVGDPGLTDYHSPLGIGTADILAGFLAATDAPPRIHFDSLPAEALAPMLAGLRLAGYGGEPEVHQSAAIVTLPRDYDAWLDGLRRKERHEIRRKVRRFEETVGPAHLVRRAGPEAVSEFAALHRMAPGGKGTFMTDEMETFFRRLERDAGAVVDMLYRNVRPVAAAFGFEEAGTYYLYNSAYDPTHRELSPGIVLVNALVRTAIRSGRTRFDFLKGDEMYKTRLGARPRALFKIRASKQAPT